MPAHDFDLFVSYHWRDRDHATAIARALQSHNLRPFLDRWYLIAGQPWPQALEQTLQSCRAVAVLIGPGDMGPWQQREMYAALDRQARNPQLPVIPVLLPGGDPALGFLSQNTWIDLRHAVDDPAELLALAKAARGEPRGPGDSPDPQSAVRICPYRGLRAFREEDAAFFLGRELDSHRVAAAVRAQALTFLIGASGSGKSSLVRAGVVPLLRRDPHPWDILTIIPKERPLFELAKALVSRLEPEMTENARLDEAEAIAESLTARPTRLADLAQRVLEKDPGTERLLLIVDQFEELFTLSDPTQRDAFINQILRGATSGRLHICATLRGDFQGKALESRALADRMQGAQQLLGPMTRDELRRAIEQPAELCRRHFESGLVDRILDDAEGGPGHLPLLEFVLEQLWRDRDRPRTHAAYDAMHGLQGALAQHADSVLARLSPPEQASARRVFLHLVRPTGTETATRRRALLTHLPDADAAMARRLAGPQERLLVTAASPGEPESVEVSHEALITSWKYLEDLVREEWAFLDWRERFHARLSDWRRDPADDSFLLDGSPLAEAESWLLDCPDNLLAEERRFIAASRTAANRLADEERERSQHELNRQRTSSRRLALAFAATVVALVGVVFYFVEARKERAAAIVAREQAEHLIEFMTFNLRDKLQPMGRLELMEDVSRAVEAYYRISGRGRIPSQETRRSSSLTRQGDVLRDQGWLAEALNAYKDSRRIFEELVKQDSRNPDWKRDLSVSLERIGEIQAAQGDRAQALTVYQDSLRIREELVKQDPHNAGWRRDLSVSLNKIGEIQAAQGNRAQALTAYQDSRRIREELLKQDPHNAERKRDLSVSLERIGEIQAVQGDHAQASASYQDSRRIREELVKQDPCNADWKRDLSVSLNKIGDIQAAQGNRASALTSYQHSRRIVEELVKQDPRNADWKRDLSVSLNKIGEIQSAQGDRAQALVAYQDSRRIVEELVKQDGHNADWRHDLSLSLQRIADIQAAQGDRVQALASYRDSRRIVEELVKQDPRNATWKRDLSVSLERIGDMLETNGDVPGALASYLKSLPLAEELARLDPLNDQWQRDLKDTRSRIAELQRRLK